MQDIVFAGIAWLILMPIIYFLPIGITLKSKISVMLLGLLFAVIGLFVTPILGLVQTILIEVLIIGVTSYFMAKKTGSFVTPNEKPYEPKPQEEHFETNDESESNPFFGYEMNKKNQEEEEPQFLEKEFMLIDEQEPDELDFIEVKLPDSTDDSTQLDDKYKKEFTDLFESNFEEETSDNKAFKDDNTDSKEAFWESLLEEYDWDILKEQNEVGTKKVKV